MTAFAVDIERNLSPRTCTRYGYGLRLFGRFLTESGRASLRIDQLTRAQLVDFYAWLSAPETSRHHKEARTPGTVRKVVEVVQLWWKWLADDSDWGEIVPRPRTIKMAGDTSTTTIAPTWAEMDAAIAGAYGWRKQLATLLRFTGLRPFQVMLATWDEVDLERGLMVISHGKTKREKQGRVIPLSAHLVDEMRTWSETRKGFVISTGLDTERERQSRGFEMGEAWARGKVRAAAWEDSPHRAFRRGFISGLKHLGADDEAVKHLVGHDLGVRGRYLDPTSAPLMHAVGLIPPFTPNAKVLPLKRGVS